RQSGHAFRRRRRPDRNASLTKSDERSPGPEPVHRAMTDTPQGFSEDALRGLADLDRRLPPGIVTLPLGRGERPGPGGTAGPSRPHYWGHRERLRQRFLTGGHAAMPEYELLELLLFDAIPRIDVKPLAKQLLAAFGDLNGVV